MASKGIPLEIGLRIDVLDDEGIWNTGRIADVAREGDDMVEIKYDGWGDEYNQWIPVSADRLAPLHTYTLVKKCWAKLTKWPWWPAFVVLRAPTTQSAAAGLEEEKKLYVEFFDSFDEDKRSRCWMQKKSVVSFQDGFEERASKNVGKKFPKYVEATQRAAAGNSPLLFSGNGTLPIEYSSKMALPLATQRQKYDSDKWFDAYRMFSKRYDVLYGYEFAADPARQFASVGSDDDDAEVAAGNGRGSGKKKKSKARSAQEDVEERSFGYEDENEPEEKEEEPEEDADAAEEEEEVEEKAPKGSARGRRNTRLQDKRQREPALPTRRTRARRVKVIEELLESSSASRTATIAQSFQVLVSPADQRDSTSDLVLDASGDSMALLREGETETGGDWSGATVHVNTTDADKQAAVSATSHDVEPVGEQLGDELKEPAASTYVGDGCGTHSRRKAKLSAPQRLSAILRKRLANTAAAGEQESAADACSEGDHWSGGSKHEIAGQPWTIGGWLVHGYRAAADK